MMQNVVYQRIQKILDSHDVVLFMEGDAAFPQCAFSALPVQLLSQLRVPFQDINVLEDQDLLKGLQQFSDWPSMPQLFIKGDFIGGSDIVRELYENGELSALLESKGLLQARTPPIKSA